MSEVKLFESYYGDHKKYGPVKIIQIPKDSFEDLQKSQDRPPLLSERIVANQHRLYFDFDSKIEVDMSERIRPLRDGLTAEETAVYEKCCAKIQNCLMQEGVPEDKLRVIGCFKPERIMLKVHQQTKAESKWKKRSLRFYCPDVISSKAMNSKIAAELNGCVQAFMIKSGWQDLFPESNMDLSIYSANAPMLILGSCKHAYRDPVRLRRMPDPSSTIANDADFLINIVDEPHQYVLKNSAGLAATMGPAAKKQRTVAPTTGSPTSTLDSAVTAAITEVIEGILKKPGVVRKVTQDDGGSIWITLDEWYCPQKQADHSSNRQYAYINSGGLTFKCHDEDCTGTYNHRPMTQLPLPIQNIFHSGGGTLVEDPIDDLYESSNSMFEIMNEKVKCEPERMWAVAPPAVHKNTKDKTMWVQPDHYDCFYSMDPEAKHATKGACGIVTDTAKCTVGIKCPVHGTMQRNDWKAVLEHVHVGLHYVQINANQMVTKVKDTEVAALNNFALDVAKEQNVKVDLETESFYVPIAGKPLVYQPGPKYADWVRRNIRNNDYLNADSGRLRRVCELFQNACDDRAPEVVRDLNLIGFSNGILHLNDNRFVEYENIVEEDYGGKVVRHFIDLKMDTNNLHTPALDRILDTQLKDRTDVHGNLYDAAEIKDWICALFGRLLFKLRSRDNLEIVPVIYGTAGTGKSSLAALVRAFFADGRWGTLTVGAEKTFGLKPLAEKEVLIVNEGSARIEEELPKTTFQCMASGESISVAKKHADAAVDFIWRTPVIFFANQMLAYNDAGGMSAARRIAGIMFDRYLPSDRQDNALEAALMAQLPATIYKCVEAYNRLIALRPQQSSSFWKICPQFFKDQLITTVETTNPFLTWLQSGEDITGLATDPQSVVLWEDELRSHITRLCPSAYRPKGRLESTAAEYGMMGWQCERKMICLQCRSIGGTKCCGKNKVKRILVFGCKILT